MRSVRRLTVTGVVVLGVLGGALLSAAPALAGEGLGITDLEFGAPGSGPGQLSLVAPGAQGRNVGSGVAVSSTGDVYVSDTHNNRVEWFNAATGTFEGQFNGSSEYEVKGVKKADLTTPPAPLVEPEGIAVDNDPSSPSFGDVYVVNNTGTVDKFSATGEFLFQLPAGGVGIAIDPSGNVWIVTHEFPEVYELNNEVKNTVMSSIKVGSFTFGLAVDSEDNVYIVEGGPSTTKYSKTGAGIGVVCGGCTDLAIDPATNDLLVDTRTSLAQYGPFGEPFGAPIHTSRSGILTGGAGIAVSPTSHVVYVAESAKDQIVTLALGPTPEAPETLKAEEPVGATKATLKGKLKPLTTALEYYFEYNTGSSCKGGSQTPVMKGKGEVSGEVTGLEPRAEYTYCLVAENHNGPTSGNEVQFTTVPAPPEVISESSSSKNRARGIFAAVINPNNSTLETTYSFEYSTEGTVAEGTKEGTLEGTVETAGEGEAGPIPAGVFEPKEVTSEWAELPEVTGTYYYRVVATNATGTTVGKVEAFTKLPTVADESAPEADLTLTEATLEASLKVDYQETEYRFEYATGENAKRLVEEGKGTPVPGGGLQGRFEDPAQPVSTVLRGLAPNTIYYYRVVAENESSKNAANLNKGEPVAGKVEEFTTRTLPFVSTGGVQNITRTTATLAGTVTPRFLNATYYFAYIDQAGYEKALAGDAQEKADPYAEGETTTPLALEASEAAQAVGPLPVAGLLPGTTYRYALVSKNEFGIRYGEDGTFTTLAGTPPTVSTGGVSNVSQNSATLSGTVSTNSLQTNYGFEIETEPGEHYGPATGLGSIGGAATEEVSVTLGKLQPGRTYYYRVEATNADGTVHGEPGTFTTPGFPALLAATPSLPLIGVPNIVFPKEEPGSTGTTTKALTNKQKLANALKRCKKDHGKSKMAKCDKQAEARYAPSKKAKKGGKK